MNEEIKYNDKVVITKGFFEGICGRDINFLEDIGQYVVEIENVDTILVKEDDIKKMPEPMKRS